MKSVDLTSQGYDIEVFRYRYVLATGGRSVISTARIREKKTLKKQTRTKNVQRFKNGIIAGILSITFIWDRLE